MKRQWLYECCLLVCISMLVLLIAGCAAPSPAKPTSRPAPGASVPTPPVGAPGSPQASAPVAPPMVTTPLEQRPSVGANALRDGINAFNMGEYGLAERKLGESFRLGLSNTPDLLRGYKTQAFVYCVTARTQLCEKSFDAAFQIDRKFSLSGSERPHPVWGPVFTKVQKRYVS